jgi:glycosyltransferase involved in cell wall biosynthesis
MVIASDIPYWKETFNYSQAIEFVDPTSPLDIKTCLLSLLSSPQTLYEKGNFGKKDVLRNYTWDTEFQKILDLYKKLLAYKQK